MVKALTRYFSYAFHGLLAIFLVAASGMALATGPRSLRLGVLPWSGATLTYVVFIGAIVGLVALALALKGKLPWLYFVWTVAVAGFLLKGYIFSPYYFEKGGLSTAIYMMVASWISIAGAWFQMRTPAQGWKRY